jgi:hypothetical protein
MDKYKCTFKKLLQKKKVQIR